MKSDAVVSSPVIAPLPPDLSERLIDRGLMHYEASLAGLAERYARGETSHTIHVWWARRPHSAMRALVFATLCKEPSPECLRTLQEIGSSPVVSPDALKNAQISLNRDWGSNPPKLLDMFGGGGTIPFEAANLGAETYTSDANELSVFIQACNLQFSQNLYGLNLAEALRSSGTRVLTQLEKDTADLFPLRQHGSSSPDKPKPFGYLWTYSTACSHCGYRFYLSKRRWLSRKPPLGVAIEFIDSGPRQVIQFAELNKLQRLGSVWAKGNGNTICPRCGHLNSGIVVSECEDELIAVVSTAPVRGKTFLPPPENSIPPLSFIKSLEQDILAELGIELPASELPRWSGIVNPALYGIKTHADFLNPRQRVVLLLLLKALRDEFNLLCNTYDEKTARYLVGFLSSLVDQVVDWNCRLSMWIPQNEQVGRAFSGPGVAMLWDYAETDQVLSGPANLWSKLDRIIKGASTIPQFPRPVTVKHGYAQNLDYPDNFFDAVITDPPYYDNIYYSILADFIYAWKRPLLSLIGLTDFASSTTDMVHELVASRNRSGSAEKAHSDYCAQLSLAFKEIERVLKPDGVFSFIYSHSSLQGWEAVLRAYRDSPLLVTSVQPLSIERRQRPRAMSSEAVNICTVFVARPWHGKRQTVSSTDFDRRVKKDFLRFGRELMQAGWKEKDAALAVFANGVGLLANCTITGADDMAILRHIVLLIRAEFPTFSLKDRKSL